MRILFATYRLHVPDDFSGSVQSTHAMIEGLRARGHDCEILATLPEQRLKHFVSTAMYRLTANKAIIEWTDSDAGYPVNRGSEWRFAERVVRAVKRRAPDVLVLDAIKQLHLLKAIGFKPTFPIVTILHEIQFTKDTLELPFADRVQLVANSPFTGGLAETRFGKPLPMVPPVVHLSQYQGDRSGAKYATLISPDHRKGLDIVLEMAARMPTTEFLLVEGWPMSSQAWRELMIRVAPLSNVHLRRSTRDMRRVYGETRVLLAPSRKHIETFGRVVPEAQSCGIPVMVMDKGSLPWVAGDGGIVFPEDSTADQWVPELERLLNDPAYYEAVSKRASANILREDFQPDCVVDKFERVLTDVCSR